MNTGILIINILLLIGEIILGYILLFGKSYLQKKGKNTADKEDSQELAMLKKLGEDIATKKDIGGITQEIKSVESKFIAETEKLKSKLTILANVQTDITSMERSAIIEINKSLFLWIESVLNIPDTTRSIAIEEYINKQNILYQKVQQDEIVLKLLIKNDCIHEYLYKITSTFLEIQIGKQLKYYKIIKINNEIDCIKPDNPSKEKREKLQRKIEERKNMIDTDTKKMFEKYDTIAPIINQFRDRCKEQIYKIIEPEH
ncbi:hypothetical protein F3B42_14250 [Bacteroides ovatus]|jgi:hypothetical protein|nr:hypothetical protein F3B42_14250 [Bacteroides ovatus]KAA4680743.1 hypothetical protein F3B41_15540 [Bacteroides ovatus]